MLSWWLRKVRRRGKMDEERIDAINRYYKENPPQWVIDDSCIKHWKEIELPAKYKKDPCSCGTAHKDKGNTWYHSTLKLQEEDYVVVKKCKKCHEILMLELDKP